MLYEVITIIFIICAITFESLSLSLAVLLLVPVSFLGVFLSFYLFDIGFDQGGFASFILLSGLTVNSAIYILTEYINLPNRTNRIQNYIKAFNHKATPIFLTILSRITSYNVCYTKLLRHINDKFNNDFSISTNIIYAGHGR